MCFRVARSSLLRIALVLFVGLALLPVPCLSMLVSALAQGQSQGRGQGNVWARRQNLPNTLMNVPVLY